MTLTLGIGREIADASRFKSAAALGALIAMSAMEAAFGRDAGKAQMKRQMLMRADQRLLGSLSIRGKYLKLVRQPKANGDPPRLKKSWRSIRERVVIQRTNGEMRNVVHAAKNCRFNDQGEIAARQVNGFIPGLRAR